MTDDFLNRAAMIASYRRNSLRLNQKPRSHSNRIAKNAEAIETVISLILNTLTSHV